MVTTTACRLLKQSGRFLVVGGTCSSVQQVNWATMCHWKKQSWFLGAGEALPRELRAQLSFPLYSQIRQESQMTESIVAKRTWLFPAVQYKLQPHSLRIILVFPLLDDCLAFCCMKFILNYFQLTFELRKSVCVTVVCHTSRHNLLNKGIYMFARVHYWQFCGVTLKC